MYEHKFLTVRTEIPDHLAPRSLRQPHFGSDQTIVL